MTRSSQEMQALFRRWRKIPIIGFVLLTLVLVVAYLLLGHHTGVSARPGLPIWFSIPALYLLHGAYCFFNWQAIKRDFMSGKSETDALRAKL